MTEPLDIQRRAVLTGAAGATTAMLASDPAAAGADAPNVALARRHLVDLWQDGKFELASEILHPDFVDHSAVAGQGPGAAGLIAFARLMKTALPDQRFEFVKIFGVGDLVVDHWILRATHTGALGAIPPTARKVEFHGTDILRVQDGRIIEIWHVEDMLTMFGQLGLVVPPSLGPPATSE